jgi:Bacterial TSP3 repeat
VRKFTISKSNPAPNIKTMKTKLVLFALLSALSLPPSALLQAATTINSSNKYAYGANLGWLNAYADGANGAVIGEYVCSGYIYAANVGWIHLGAGAPANQIQYQNNSGTDYGVNREGLGNLRGYAYGANIGWVNFENTGAPKVDLATGKFSGSVWSANCGWISLSNAFAFVQTDTIAPGADTDGDGIADAWELTHTNSLTAFTAATDTDGDGMSDQQEYLADTNPLEAGDHLHVLAITGSATGTTNNLTWTSKPTRQYVVLQATNVATLYQTNIALGLVLPDPGATTTRGVNNTPAAERYFKLQALRPLAP